MTFVSFFTEVVYFHFIAAAVSVQQLFLWFNVLPPEVTFIA
jgi:hypothetical protein